MNKSVSPLIKILSCLMIFWAIVNINPENLSAESNKLITTTILHNGISRIYHVHLPPGLDEKKEMPLVIVLHGGGGTGKGFSRMKGPANFIDSADRNGFVVVFPEGVGRQWNDGRREIYRDQKKIIPPDDVGFISLLIEAMIESYHINPKRVYATGISNGGFMSSRLALELSEKIRAVAPVSAQLSKELEDKKPSRPVSLFLVNGTDDPLVPFMGGHVRILKNGRSRGEVFSTQTTIKRFVKFDQCPDDPVKMVLPDRAPDDQTFVSLERYSHCSEEAEVALVKVSGGGHTWPGGNQYLPVGLVGRVSQDISATELIVDFFMSKE